MRTGGLASVFCTSGCWQHHSRSKIERLARPSFEPRVLLRSLAYACASDYSIGSSAALDQHSWSLHIRLIAKAVAISAPFPQQTLLDPILTPRLPSYDDPSRGLHPEVQPFV